MYLMAECTHASFLIKYVWNFHRQIDIKTSNDLITLDNKTRMFYKTQLWLILCSTCIYNLNHKTNQTQLRKENKDKRSEWRMKKYVQIEKIKAQAVPIFSWV